MLELFNHILDRLAIAGNFFGSYIGFTAICFCGIYLTIASRGKQFIVLFNMRSVIQDLIKESTDKTRAGIHPIKLLFASVGGMIGIGNIVGVGLAVMVGGPGSILWMWVASLSGMLIKYSEIYLGIKYRIASKNNKSYNGGPMYYMQKVFKTKFFAYLSAFLLCIYGIEIFQFGILVNRFQNTFGIDRSILVYGLLFLSLYASSGGISRLATICTFIMPIFLVLYSVACFIIIFSNFTILPEVFLQIIDGAFNGHAAIGGFAGSAMINTAYLGSSKAIYSGDIGVGFDSVMQSETRVSCPIKQARLSIIALFMDTCICTLSCLTIGVSGAWYRMNHLEPSDVMPRIFGEYFPFSEYFLTLVFFFSGFTTVIAYFTVGIKSAMFISHKYGKIIYTIFGGCCFVFFSYFSEEKAMVIMSITGLLLLTLNIFSILKMRKEIKFYEEDAKF
ncbi:MAG: amino acid carrier protein [Alphaproteobacteria bacterium]|nr:amino acid carrier protein [Alphaproteobacteria bacterium]